MGGGGDKGSRDTSHCSRTEDCGAEEEPGPKPAPPLIMRKLGGETKAVVGVPSKHPFNCINALSSPNNTAGVCGMQ